MFKGQARVHVSTDETKENRQSSVRLNPSLLCSMLDGLSTNVMMADPNTGEILFANRTSLETLEKLKAHLPGEFAAETLVGSSIDMFHKNPSHQRRILKDPDNLPWRTHIQVGPETLNLKVSAIFDRSGSYVGAAVNWDVETHTEQAIQFVESDVKTVVEDVAKTAADVKTLSDKMSQLAVSGTTQSQHAAAAADQTASNVQTVAAASEELAASIQDIARQIASSSEITRATVSQTEGADGTVRGLHKAAEKIGEIVELIQDIAAQTNLLALNATIEAARAGDAGKGFAVVASEVKALATQTSQATDEIRSQIKSIQDATAETVSAIETISGRITDIDGNSSTIASAVEEQGAATQEISRNIQQASDGTTEVSQSVRTVNDLVASTGEAAEELIKSSLALSNRAEETRAKVSEFLERMRDR